MNSQAKQDPGVGCRMRDDMVHSWGCGVADGSHSPGGAVQTATFPWAFRISPGTAFKAGSGWDINGFGSLDYQDLMQDLTI